MYVLLWIVLGALVGWVTGRPLKGNHYRPWVDVIAGIAGAIGGGFLIQYGGVPGPSEIVPTLLSVILGAVVLTVLIGFINGRMLYA